MSVPQTPSNKPATCNPVIKHNYTCIQNDQCQKCFTTSLNKNIVCSFVCPSLQYLCKQAFLFFPGIYLTTVLIKICLHVLCVVIVMHIYHKAGKVEMSTVYRKVTVMLVAITCMRRPQPNISETLTEKTELNCSGETEVSDHTVDLPSEPSEPPVLHAQMSRGQRPHGHLSPIPGNKISPQNGQVRSGSSAKPARSVSSAKSASVKSFSAKNDGEMSHWRQLSAALERLLFVVFLVVTCLVHFIFLMVLGLS